LLVAGCLLLGYDMDEQTPKPRAWLRFGLDGPDAIFLSDRSLWSATHREHFWSNRRTIGSDDSGFLRYVVGAFPAADAELRSCEVCGEPNALVAGPGVGNILYSGDDLVEAERVFDEAFN
jgi:hypothetical protein